MYVYVIHYIIISSSPILHQTHYNSQGTFEQHLLHTAIVHCAQISAVPKNHLHCPHQLPPRNGSTPEMIAGYCRILRDWDVKLQTMPRRVPQRQLGPTPWRERTLGKFLFTLKVSIYFLSGRTSASTFSEVEELCGSFWRDTTLKAVRGVAFSSWAKARQTRCTPRWFDIQHHTAANAASLAPYHWIWADLVPLSPCECLDKLHWPWQNMSINHNIVGTLAQSVRKSSK